jgi:hypothetical protein
MTNKQANATNKGMQTYTYKPQGSFSPPNTEYVFVQRKSKGGTIFGNVSSAVSGGTGIVTRESQSTRPPFGLPGWMGNRRIITAAWVSSMIIVGFDDWKNHGVLPRPSRLWYSSVVYGILALLSMAEPLVPICNALAVGYAVTLLWQYYNGTGAFA